MNAWVFLDDERAVKVACGDDLVIVLGESGRVFEYSLNAAKMPLEEVSELSGIKINEISGVDDHFFAVSEDGKVFGRWKNSQKRFGMPSNIKEMKEFKVIESLSKYHIVEAFTGITWHQEDRHKKQKSLKVSQKNQSFKNAKIEERRDKRNARTAEIAWIDKERQFITEGRTKAVEKTDFRTWARSQRTERKRN